MRSLTKRTLFSLAALTLAPTQGTTLPAASQSQCEMPVPARPQPHIYQGRGDRCEGYFAGPTGSSLRLLAFGPATPPFPAAATVAEIRWLARGRETIVVRAEYMQGGTNYQMDSRQVADAGRFAWPLSLIRQRRLNPAMFEVACWKSGHVYVPCHYGPQGSAMGTGLILKLVAQESVNGLRASVYTVDAAGREDRQVIPERPVAGGPFVRGRRIRIPLDGLGRGRYRVIVRCSPSRLGCNEEPFDILLGS